MDGIRVPTRQVGSGGRKCNARELGPTMGDGLPVFKTTARPANGRVPCKLLLTRPSGRRWRVFDEVYAWRCCV